MSQQHASAVERLRRALAWAIGEGKQVPGVISTQDLVRVEQALRGDEPFAAEHYPTLQLFAQIMWRIELPEGIRGLNLGEALEAITERTSSLPPWSFVPEVEPETFRSLEYAVGAEGIDREYRNNREGWIAHGEQSKRFVCEAIEELDQRRVAWVFGAGRAYDLPLEELAARFDKVVLVDIDRQALQRTLASLAASLRVRCELVAADLTGIAAAWRSRTLEAVRGTADARAAAARLHEQFCSYTVADERPWRFLGDGADLIVSQMLLSQLNDPLERYPRRLFEERFEVPLFEQDPRVRVTNMLFAHRVQHDHLRFLRQHAAAAVLTSDIAEHYTKLTATGGVESVGDEMLLLGAYRLEERVPRGLAIVRHEEWHWHRALPRQPEAVGSRMRIGGLFLRARGLPDRTCV